MNKLALIALLFVMSSTATATTTQRWGDLTVNLESCFRASSGVDAGCNGYITNKGAQPIQVELKTARDTVILPDDNAVKAKSVVFGGAEDDYSVTQIIPVGLSVRFQLNYNITRGVKSLKSLGVGDAEFKNVPLAQELPDEPAVNVAGKPVLTDSREQSERTVLDCIRQKTLVTCSFKTQSKVDDNLRMTVRRNSDTAIISRKGLVLGATQVALAGESDSYSVQKILPARRALLSQASFNLPETDTFIPYLRVDNLSFFNVPITTAAGPRILNTGGDLVDTYRLREYAGKVDSCSYVRDGLRCNFTLTNRTDGGFRLTTRNSDLSLLSNSGEWFGPSNLTAGGEMDRYSVDVPLPANGTGTLSVLFGAPAGMTSIPVLLLGGMTFENIPVK